LSDEWDFYFARVNDAVASIFVDLGIRSQAPLEARPWLLWVWITLAHPKPDGLASNEEAKTLNEIGASLDAMISVTCGAQMIGRITGGGRREIYFYGTEPGELQSAAAQAMKSFEGYRHEAGSAFQPGWEHYLQLLYPSATNLQRMRNRRLLEELAMQGDVHELARKVEHWLYFADEAGRVSCRDTLTAIGFEVENEAVAEEEGEHLPFSLVVSRVDSVDTHSINGITLELARLAGEHRGDYDGWGCEPAKES
jgi:regulator of RNase E activity RraB